MAAQVASSAYALAPSLEDADVVVLNTCSFIQPATEESIAETFALLNEWRPRREGRRVIVAGCMPSRYGTDLIDALPEADAFLPVAEEPKLLSVLERLLGTPAAATAGPRRLAPGATAYLKISEGCDRRCAYCTIPSIRGPFVSETSAAVLAEARHLIAGGARELVLVGQDIARWGDDLADPAGLAGLVSDLAALDGDYRVRLMYLQPDGVTDRLLHAIAESDRVCRYLDIPLQHSAAGVLERMGRTGSAEAHLRLIDRIRSILPDVILRTTVMAGFPGESEADVSELEGFIDAAGLDYVGVFAFSPEEGTRAASLVGQVPDEVRAERAQRIRDAADAVGFARAAAVVGTRQRVLVEAVEEGETIGRTCGQAPDVDGITVIDAEVPVGEFALVRIIDSAGYDLIGEPE